MVIDIHTVLNTFPECPRMDTKFKDQRKLELSRPTDSLELVAMNVLGPRLKIKSDNQPVVITTDRWTKLTRTIPTENMRSKKSPISSSMTGLSLMRFLIFRFLIMGNDSSARSLNLFASSLLRQD